MDTYNSVAIRQQRCKVAMVIGVAMATLYLLWPFLTPLVWSAVLGLMFIPLQRRLENYTSPVISAGVCVLLICLVILNPLALLVSEIFSELPSLHALYLSVTQGGLHIPEMLHRFPKVYNYTESFVSRHPISEISSHIPGLAPHVMLITHRFGEILEGVSITLLSTFFILAYHQSLSDQFDRVLDYFLGKTGGELAEKIVSSVRGTVTGLVAVGLAEGVLSFPVLLFTHTPHPAILAFVIGVMAMIPMMAPICLAGISCYMFATVGAKPAIIDAVAIMAILFVGDHFVRPSLIGGTNKLPFMLVILGIFGGLHAFGILGLFIGPAFFTVAIQLWRMVAKPKTEETQEYSVVN